MRIGSALGAQAGVLVAVVAYAGLGACGASGRDRPSPPERPATVPSPVGAAAASRPAAAPPDEPPAAIPVPAPTGPAVDRVVAEWKPAPDEPPELAALKTRLVPGQTASNGRLIKELQKLGSRYPKNEEVPFLLGQLYLEKLWVGDGLKTFRRLLQLQPAYRENPFVIRAAVTGLGNDRDAHQVRRFLKEDIGRPAAPYLEEVLYGDYRQQVKDRAAAILRELE